MLATCRPVERGALPVAVCTLCQRIAGKCPSWRGRLAWCFYRLVCWVQSISRGKAGRGERIVGSIAIWMRLFNGQSHRPDLEAIVSSGLFDECASGVASLAVAGVDGLGDVNHDSALCALSVLRYCRQQPGAEARIRSLAPALKWCLEHDLDYMEQLGMTTGSYAAQICESVAAHCRATVQS